MATGDSSGSSGSSAGASLPIGVERALARATRDAEFRADLRERRAAAAEAVGIKLTAAERAVLEAIDDAQLDGMIDHLEDRVVEVPRVELVEATAGIRPGRPVAQGIRPEGGQVKGIRPGLPIALAAGAVVVGGACATMCMTAGSRPDEPPPPGPTEPVRPLGEVPSGTPPDGGTPDGGDGGDAPKDD